MKIISKIKENKLEIIFFLIIAIILIIITYEPKEEKKVPKKEEIKEEASSLIVDVKGAVKTPGVYELDSDKRVIDAINKAGGLLETADTSLINLSKALTDEMVIMIYTKEQMQKEDIVCPPCECEQLSDACIEEENQTVLDKETKEEGNSKEDVKIEGKININTASIEELMTLDGIGETKAKSIAGYRDTNGKFKDITEIQNVSGIGESTYEKIKDDITV